MYQDEPVQKGVKVTLSKFHPSFGYVLTCDLQLPFILSAKAALSSRHGRGPHPVSL